MTISAAVSVEPAASVKLRARVELWMSVVGGVVGTRVPGCGGRIGGVWAGVQIASGPGYGRWPVAAGSVQPVAEMSDIRIPFDSEIFWRLSLSADPPTRELDRDGANASSSEYQARGIFGGPSTVRPTSSEDWV